MDPGMTAPGWPDAAVVDRVADAAMASLPHGAGGDRFDDCLYQFVGSLHWNRGGKEEIKAFLRAPMRAALGAVAPDFAALRTRAETAEAAGLERDRLREALDNLHSAIAGLMDDSAGVYGLHRNGDETPWEELTTNGPFEDWLGPALDGAATALRALRPVQQEAGT